MAKSPYYSITLEKGNIDVTNYITSIDYEDCTDEDDLITLSVEGADISVIDKNWFDIGQKFNFIFGFIGGKNSGIRKGQITEIDFDYIATKVNITVKARDLGFITKKLSISKVYKDKTASEIVNDIANIFGLNADIQDTQKKYEIYATAGKSYNAIIKDLAQKEGASNDDKKGVWDSYIRGDTLSFKQRDLSVASKRLFEYCNGDSIIKDISVNYEDSEDGASTSVKSSGIDMDTGKPFESITKSADSKAATTGDKFNNYDVNSVLKGTTGGSNLSDVANAGKTLVVPSNNKKDSDSKTSKQSKEKSDKILKLTASLELDPTINSGDIVTFSGLAQKHNGNWCIKKTTHKIGGSDASTDIECYRNGSKTSSSNNSTKSEGEANKTVGDKDGKTSSQIRVFDENSKRLK